MMKERKLRQNKNSNYRWLYDSNNPSCDRKTWYLWSNVGNLNKKMRLNKNKYAKFWKDSCWLPELIKQDTRGVSMVNFKINIFYFILFINYKKLGNSINNDSKEKIKL